MRLSISEVLSKADSLETKEEKFDFLSKNWHPIIAEFVNIAFNRKLKWKLPKGMPPIKHEDNVGAPTRLYYEVKRLYRFFDAPDKPAPAITPFQRERLFMEMLSDLTPEDAELVVAAKDNAWPYKTLTKKFFEEVGVING